MGGHDEAPGGSGWRSLGDLYEDTLDDDEGNTEPVFLLLCCWAPETTVESLRYSDAQPRNDND